MSIALHLETKHCIPFVHLLRYFWLKAALFALCQDSGAKTTLSQCEVHRSRTGPDLPEGTRQSLSMQIALHHSISHEFYRRFTLPIADVSQNPPFLSVKSFLDSVCRAKPRAGCKCCVGKACLKPDHKLHLYKQVLRNIHERALAYVSYSSIGQSQDMWHCGRRCFQHWQSAFRWLCSR